MRKAFNMFSEKIQKFKDFLSTPFDELGHFGRFVLFQLRLWPLCLKLLRRNRADQQAAALTYHTLFGFIPLAIMMLIIFQSLPGSEDLGQKLRNVIYENIQLDKFQYPDPNNPEETIAMTDYVDNLVGGFFENSGKGSAAVISILFIAWAAIKLLTTIERTFNNMWNISGGRTILMRIFYYWTPLTLGPLLIGAGLYLKTLDVINTRMGMLINAFNSLGGWLIPIAAFFLLYWSMPNTKVRPLPALWAATVAAIIWIMLKNLYGFYIVNFMPFRELYGALGLIPLTMLWAYISWLVVLFGVQLSYATQNLTKLDSLKSSSVSSSEKFAIAGEQTIIAVMGYISEQFDSLNNPVTCEKIVRKFNLPYNLTRHILDELIEAGLLVYASQPHEGYCLGRSSDKISLAEIKTLAADVRINNYTVNSEQLKETLNEYNKQLNAVTLSDIAAKKVQVQSDDEDEKAGLN